MEQRIALAAFAALSQTTRLDVFRLLVAYEPDGLPSGEIARRLDVPANTLSSHLGVLARAGLVMAERQGRTIIYRARMDNIQSLVGFMVNACCQGRYETCGFPLPVPPQRQIGGPMSDRVYNVLFLCTGNSVRSILAESILRMDGEGRFRAFSAGSHPKGDVHPLARKVLGELGYPTDDLRSKSWDEFSGADAPQMDFVFTVCDNAAGEICPIWPGHPLTAHWGIEDPAQAEGAELQKEAAFVTAFRYLKNRISVFLALPIEKVDRLALGNRLRDIGQLDGATMKASADRV
ncbi:Transcriptional regulator, ArsR family [uncultured Alphaproteobacteria bacterium]|uniref:Transcriptional regulator, ArsR family n=1 Tax=uncultured Alphaproteobacteria bacterium TaxID=91750 RepID=A0A212JMK9_9PROT|nr:Transcriptional regulator, ArsR family [uncultured Alphaproteobacteria bacterium]